MTFLATMLKVRGHGAIKCNYDDALVNWNGRGNRGLLLFISRKE